MSQSVPSGCPNTVRGVVGQHSGTALKQLREDAGLTVRDLASRSGLSKTTLARAEASDQPLSAGERALVELALAAPDGTLGGDRLPVPAGEIVDGEPAPTATYPSAPTVPVERRQWFNDRNDRIQRTKPRLPEPTKQRSR